MKPGKNVLIALLSPIGVLARELLDFLLVRGLRVLALSTFMLEVEGLAPRSIKLILAVAENSLLIHETIVRQSPVVP